VPLPRHQTKEKCCYILSSSNIAAGISLWTKNICMRLANVVVRMNYTIFPCNTFATPSIPENHHLYFPPSTASFSFSCRNVTQRLHASTSPLLQPKVLIKIHCPLLPSSLTFPTQPPAFTTSPPHRFTTSPLPFPSQLQPHRKTRLLAMSPDLTRASRGSTTVPGWVCRHQGRLISMGATNYI
jgi:hypothetical protein